MKEKIEHLRMEEIDFVPTKYLEGFDDIAKIGVFSHRLNNRVYKKPKRFIGYFYKNPKNNDWCFAQNSTNVVFKTFTIVWMFFLRLNKGLIEYDEENGEIIVKDKELME